MRRARAGSVRHGPFPLESAGQLTLTALQAEATALCCALPVP